MDELEDLDDASNINSELRYITLELMKLAHEKHKNFKDLALEFVNNVYWMKQLIEKTNKAFKQEGKKK